MLTHFEVKLRCPKCGRIGWANLDQWTFPIPDEVPSTLTVKSISPKFRSFERPSDAYGNLDFECVYHAVSAEARL